MTINTHPNIHQQIICANVFVRKDGKYLVLKRSPLKKYAPNVVHPIGGKVDIGENPLAAAIREVREEAGITIKNIRLEANILEVQPYAGEPYNWLIYHFSADYEAGQIGRTEEGELLLLSADELKSAELFPSVEPLIDHILDREQGAVFATYEYNPVNHTIAKQTLNYCVM